MTPAQCTVRTATLAGVQALDVDVEVDVGAGLPSFSIVGLGDLAVQEARERVRSALRASGFELPNARIVVNLAPGPLRKHGTGFDLPIALGLLVATKQLSSRFVTGALAVGELSLGGLVRPVPGMLAYALHAKERCLDVIGPLEVGTAGFVEGLGYRGLQQLTDVRTGSARPPRASRVSGVAVGHRDDFDEVLGQEGAVRALTIASAGGHNVLMVGPPGSGKTMLARRLPSILPPLDDSERLQTALIHSVAGLDDAAVLGGERPFRAPHHSASIAGLVGGGTPPKPGEASLAHHGVLFLDEMVHFGPATLQCLRQPLEDGHITLVRSEGRLSFPARFMLVGAVNPCPCGFLGDPNHRCTCPPAVIDRYTRRIGGPLMDRIDLVVGVERPDPGRLLAGASSEPSERLRDRVLAARAFRAWSGTQPSGGLSGSELLAACGLGLTESTFLQNAARTQSLSGRGITRLLRVARTIADLDEKIRVDADDLAEALSYRSRGAR